MRIIGVTCHTGDGALQTVLVRSSISLQNGVVRKILPWFFTQAIPLFGVLPESCVVIRLQTKTDPFRHLRLRKSPPFDGKGFNLRRSERHGGFVCIDEWLRMPIEDFNHLCPGFFYGTVEYPNLNILLSQRRFRQHVVNASKLWAIMYDCLLCGQFKDLQQTEADFKQEMRRKYLSTQLKDFRPEIAELEERIEMSDKYSELKDSLQQMFVTLHSHQVQHYQDDIKQLKLMLREAVYEKEQLLAVQAVHDHDTTAAITGEIAAASILIRKNELENLLIFCEQELREAKANLELRKAFETSLETLKIQFNEMENIVDQLNSIRFLESELESVRCSIDNNQSVLMLSNTNYNSEKRIYISNLQLHKQSLKLEMASAQENVKRLERQKCVFIDQLQTLKDLFNTSTTNDDTHQAELIDQLQQTIVKIVETTDTFTTYEMKIENFQQKIWQNYLEMCINVPFAELVSIASVKLAIEMLDENLNEDFLGFVYERALEAGIRTKWCEGISCSAMFRTMNGVTRVKQLMEKNRSMKPFLYIVLETRVRTNLNNFLSNTVPEGDTGPGYELTVANVNTVVQHMMEQLRAKRELNAAGECLEHLTATKEQLLAKIDGLYTGSCIPWPRTKLQELPSLETRCIMAKNQQIRLRARYDALEKFVRQIEGSDPLPNADELKLEDSRLNEQLKAILQEEDHNKKSYYNLLHQLTKKCDTMQFTLQRNEEEFCPMSEGLSSAAYEKLIGCWTTCSEFIMRTIPTIEYAANQFVYADEVPPAEIKELNERIQSLDLREKSLVSRITSTEAVLEDYQRENKLTPENTLSNCSLPQRGLQKPDGLLNKITSTQKELQQLPPGCSIRAIANMKNKLNRLRFLERTRTEARELCLNNLILPIIDKLHVQKLRQGCQLFTSVSEDLPELGASAQVFFEYEKHDPEYEEPGFNLQNPFSLHRIKSIHVHNSGAKLQQESISKQQRQLAFLVLFISFIYCDGCKLLLLDKAFEQLFDCGIVSLVYVLEKHFPAMQFLILDKE